MPKGVEVPLPLQAYFRINGENTGQFERTLIVVDEGAKVHYIEGCTAPIYTTDSLHAAVVEVIALPGSQGPLHDDPELVERRLQPRDQAGPRPRATRRSSGSTRTRARAADDEVPRASTCAGEGATAEVIRVAVAGKGQHQDTGAKAIHLAPNTRSRIVSKSVSKDGGRATYRGHAQGGARARPAWWPASAATR